MDGWRFSRDACVSEAPPFHPSIMLERLHLVFTSVVGVSIWDLPVVPLSRQARMVHAAGVQAVDLSPSCTGRVDPSGTIGSAGEAFSFLTGAEVHVWAIVRPVSGPFDRTGRGLLRRILPAEGPVVRRLGLVLFDEVTQAERRPGHDHDVQHAYTDDHEAVRKSVPSHLDPLCPKSLRVSRRASVISGSEKRHHLSFQLYCRERVFSG